MPKGRARNNQPIPSRPQMAAATAAAPTMTPQLMLGGFDPTGKIVAIDVVNSKTGWSDFELSDGTVVRIKGVMIDAKKAVDQYAPDGKPIYLLQMTLVNDLVVPDSLLKPK